MSPDDLVPPAKPPDEEHEEEEGEGGAQLLGDAYLHNVPKAAMVLLEG